MDSKHQIQDIPRALREILERGRREYEALVRRTRWGQGPIYICGCGASTLVTLTGVYGFEGLLGWPVVARPAAAFQIYSIPVLQPRSVLLAVCASGKDPEILELAHIARSRGATLLALTGAASSPLAEAADGVFLAQTAEAEDAALTIVALHFALNYIAFVAARVLKRPNPQLDLLEEEFEKLPEQVEWALSQLPEAVRALASALKGLRDLWVVGGGFYHPLAILAGRRLKALASLHAEGIEASEFCGGPLQGVKSSDAILFLSGSRSRIKKQIQQAAGLARTNRTRVLSITDRNDRELAGRSDLALLVPAMTEVVSSSLALSLLEWLTFHVAQESGREQQPAQVRQASKRGKDTGG